MSSHCWSAHPPSVATSRWVRSRHRQASSRACAGGNRIALTVDIARTMKSFQPNQIVLMHANLPTITPDEPGLAVQQTNDLATRDFRPYSAPVR